MSKFHIGKKIKEVVDQSRFGVTEFAELINKSRTVVYDIFERDTLDTGLLQQISKVLNHNFFKYYSHEVLSTIKEDRAGYLTHVEFLRSLNEEIKLMRKQLGDLEKKYEGLAKDQKTEGKVPYKRKKKK